MPCRNRRVGWYVVPNVRAQAHGQRLWRVSEFFDDEGCFYEELFCEVRAHATQRTRITAPRIHIARPLSAARAALHIQAQQRRCVLLV